jgi:hypothetical protein
MEGIKRGGAKDVPDVLGMNAGGDHAVPFQPHV